MESFQVLKPPGTYREAPQLQRQMASTSVEALQLQTGQDSPVLIIFLMYFLMFRKKINVEGSHHFKAGDQYFM